MKFTSIHGGKLACLLALALLVTLGVIPAVAQEEAPGDEPAPAFDSLKMSMNTGMLPIRGNIEIVEDGSFEFVQTSGVGQDVERKTAEGELSEEDLEAMRAAVAAVDWAGLKDRYFNPMIADAPGYAIVLVDEDGAEHRVVLDGMAEDTPEALKQLHQRLRTLYRAQQERAE